MFHLPFQFRHLAVSVLLATSCLLTDGACSSSHRKVDGTCGNGMLELTEECDQDRFWGQTCEGYGFQGGFLSCSAFCTVDIATCHGYLPTCGNGLVENLEQCDSTELSGIKCESWGFDGGTLSCTAACTFDTSGCTGTCASSCILNARRCVNDWIEVCVAQAGACNAWNPEMDCASLGQSCVPLTFGTVQCETLCSDACIVGDKMCSEDADALLVCEEAGSSDCNQWVPQACGEGRICVVGRETACQDQCANPCTAPEEGHARCSLDGGSLEECRSITDDCRRWVPDVFCAGGDVCLPWMLSCESAGTLDTCQEARWAPGLPYVISGTDFAADFTDDSTGLDDAAGCALGTAGAEAFWKTRLSFGQTVVVSAAEGPGLRFRVHRDCDSLECLAAGDRLVFTAPSTADYLFSAEGWGSGFGAYEIRMESAVLLGVAEPCLPSDPARVCSTPAWCGADSASPTGYACKPASGGDLCVDALQIGPGDHVGALQGLGDQVEFPGITGTVEQWWMFTATGDATVVFSVTAAFATNLLVFADCPDVPDAPLVAISGIGDPQVRLQLATGQTVRVVVEKISQMTSATLPYDYWLRISVLAGQETGLCTDGLDNDEDGAIDCADADCAGLDGACLVEWLCGDGMDDDADGATDCADADCAGQEACWTAKALYTQLSAGAPADFEGRRLRFMPRPGDPREYDWFLESPAEFFITPGTAGFGMDVVDDGLYALTLPMRFPFHGRLYESVWVSSNGWLTFSQPGGAQPYESPALLASLPTIALMWDDLSRIQFGDEFNADWGWDAISGRIFWAFTFTCREYMAPANLLWAQLVLFDDGEIRMDYLTCGINDAIVGIADPGLGPIPAPVSFLP